MKLWKANLILLTITMIWGYGFIATDVALDNGLTTPQIQVIRFGLAAILIAIIFHKQIFTSTKNEMKYGIILGLFFAAGMTLQTYGLQFTVVSKSSFITVTNVVFVPILLFIFAKVRPKAYLWYGIITMLIGFVILTFKIDIFNLSGSIKNLDVLTSVNQGDFLTLLGAIAFAIHIILTGRFVKNERAFPILFFQLVAATLISFVLGSISNEGMFSINTQALTDSIFPLAFMIVFSSVVSFGGQLVVQKHVPATNVALIFSTEALFATFFAIILGYEPYELSIIIGAIVITTGIIWAETNFEFIKRKNPGGSKNVV